MDPGGLFHPHAHHGARGGSPIAPGDAEPLFRHHPTGDILLPVLRDHHGHRRDGHRHEATSVGVLRRERDSSGAVRGTARAGPSRPSGRGRSATRSGWSSSSGGAGPRRWTPVLVCMTAATLPRDERAIPRRARPPGLHGKLGLRVWLGLRCPREGQRRTRGENAQAPRTLPARAIRHGPRLDLGAGAGAPRAGQ